MVPFMSYWCAARLLPQREQLATHCLTLAGYQVYLPRLRERRWVRGRRVERQPPLFPGYLFVWVELQWSRARWSPGISNLIMNGIHPARVPDGVIAELRARERNGLVELPAKSRFRAGDRVLVIKGPFQGHLALYAGMAPHERVAVLLQLFGGQQRVELAAAAIEAGP